MTEREKLEAEWARFEAHIVKPAVAETVPSVARMAFVVGYHVALLKLCETPETTPSEALSGTTEAFEEEGEKWRQRLSDLMKGNTR